MPTQGRFYYEREGVVLRWKMGVLTARWENGVRCFFRSWEAALGCVLHPNNDKVLLRIRP